MLRLVPPELHDIERIPLPVPASQAPQMALGFKHEAERADPALDRLDRHRPVTTAGTTQRPGSPVRAGMDPETR